MKFTKLALATVMLLPLATVAQAADPTDGKSEAIAVEKMICEQLYVHTAAEDVAFKPGVDVDGNAVAPAEMPSQGAAITAPDYIEVPLTVDLAQRLNQPVPEGVKMEGVIGNLRLYKDGRISYNGNDILAHSSAMCGKDLTVEPAAAAIKPSFEVIAPQAPLAGATVQSATETPTPPSTGGLQLSKKSAYFTGQPAE